MEFSQEYLNIVVCPKCAGNLFYTREKVLLCPRCRVCYPVKDGVPQLSIDLSIPISGEGKMVQKPEVAFFTIEKGPQAGDTFTLDKNTCKAIGRKVEDLLETKVIAHSDLAISLDDQTQKIVKNYLKKKHPAKIKEEEQTELGHFKRLTDLILHDPGVSRLHAMLFYDDNGVGLLDLLSRNGTYVNGKEVEACHIKPGDEITIGDTKFKFTIKS